METMHALYSEPVLTDATLAVRGPSSDTAQSDTTASRRPLCPTDPPFSLPQRGALEAVMHAVFDPTHEALWTATDGGTVTSLTVPDLQRYAVTWRAHSGPVVALLPLVGSGAAVSLGPTSIRVHTLGCVQQLARDTPAGEAEGGDGPDVFTAAALEHPHGVKCVLARSTAYLQTYDAGSDTFGARLEVPAPCTVLAQGGGLLACGHTTGELSLRDPRARLKCEASLVAHGGQVVAIAAKGDVMVSTGLAPARGARRGPGAATVLEPTLKVWDIRSTVRPLAQVPFPGGPAAVAFMPRLTTTVLVLSHAGFFSIQDAVSPSSMGTMVPVDGAQGAGLCCCDVSTTGEAVAVGDAAGLVHLFATHDAPRVSMYDAHLEPPAARVQVTPPEVACEAVVVPPAPFAFGDGSTPLSAISPEELITVGAPPRHIDPSMVKGMRVVDFVGYVTNPHHKRGLPPGQATRLAAPLLHARVTSSTRNTRDGRGAGRRRPAEAGRLPEAYHYTDAARAAGPTSAGPKAKDKDKAEGSASVVQRAMFDYDFSAFNAARLAGLENDLANALVNPLVQLLYYQPPVRAALLRHVCDKEHCLTCELGFLAHSLWVSAQGPSSGTCRPANLVRSLRQVKEASALGLLEASDEPGYRPEPSLVRRAQALARFLLEQLAKEDSSGGGGGTTVERVFGAGVRTRTTCGHCGAEAPPRVGRSLAFDLLYPATRRQGPRPAFSQVLAHSLSSRSEVRAWCEAEKGYTKANSTKELSSLPHCLLVCSNIREPGDLHWWGVPDPAIAVGVEAARRATAASSAKGDVPEAVPYNALEVAPITDAWLPHVVRVTLRGDGTVAVAQADTVGELEPEAGAAAGGGTSVVYQLSGVVSCIRSRVGEEETVGMSAPEVQRRSEGHLVAHLRVDALPGGVQHTPGKAGMPTPGVSPLPPGAGRRGATAEAVQEEPSQPGGVPEPEASPSPPTAPSTPVAAPHSARDDAEAADGDVPATPAAEAGRTAPTSEWVIFNDFTVAPTPREEVGTLYGCSKVPCVLLFSRVDAPQPPAVPPPVVTEAHYLRLTRARPPAPGATFRVLDMQSERPGRGMLVGIDAEFVALSPPEKSIRADGTDVTLRPSRLGLARVSVVRGDGPNAGLPLQDDYIRSVEPVYDYLTRFSGLTPADLDPQLCGTRHGNGVTSLKAAYLKLRYLLDAGVTFCGHGLASDFRCINLVVPPDQVVDTVELFHFKRQRKLSLRFLARRLLGIDIQQGSHDSIEDARTALRLYAKYQELQQDGTFRDVLLDLYRHGKAYGWGGES